MFFTFILATFRTVLLPILTFMVEVKGGDVVLRLIFESVRTTD